METNTVYLISKEKVDFEGIVHSDTLKAIDLEIADCVVYHSSVDLARELPLALTRLAGKVSKIIYMNGEINPLLYCIFMGLDADIYDDESGLESSDTLMFYIENYKDTGLTMSPPNTDVDTLMKSLEVFTNAGTDEVTRMVTNTFWVDTLKRAASNIDASVQRSLAVNSEVTKAFAETRGYIDAIIEGHGRTTEQLQQMKASIDAMQDSLPQNPGMRRNTPSYYPTIPLPAHAAGRTLYVKALTPCRFLVSFFIAFEEWSKANQFADIRLLIIIPNLDMIKAKYKGLPELNSEGISFMNMSNMYFVTHDPRKAVMDRFFNIASADGFVVIDAAYGTELLASNKLKKLYATSSISAVRDVIREKKIQTSQIIFSGANLSGALSIPNIPKYGDLPITQRAPEYASKMGVQFKSLLDHIRN